MKKYTLAMLFTLSFAFASPVFADAGVVEETDSGIVLISETAVRPPVTVVIDGGVINLEDPVALDSPQTYALMAVKHVKNGDWLNAIGCVIVLFVALFRMFGKRLHDAIPDTSALDKPFWFLLETKPGKWLTNFLTVTAGGLGSVYLAGETPDWPLMKTILSLSFTVAGIWAFVKDLWEWIAPKLSKKPEEAPPAAPAT